MQSFVLHLDTSVSDVNPDLRQCCLRINSLVQTPCVLGDAEAELYSQISFQVENLTDWVRVQAPISAIAQLQVAGLIDVRVEG